MALKIIQSFLNVPGRGRTQQRRHAPKAPRKKRLVPGLSRILCRARASRYAPRPSFLSRLAARSLAGVRHTRDRETGRLIPYFALHRIGFVVPPTLLPTRWALTPPLHPYRPCGRRFVFCDTVRPCGIWPARPALSRGIPPCGVRTFLSRRLRAASKGLCPGTSRKVRLSGAAHRGKEICPRTPEHPLRARGGRIALAALAHAPDDRRQQKRKKQGQQRL